MYTPYERSLASWAFYRQHVWVYIFLTFNRFRQLVQAQLSFENLFKIPREYINILYWSDIYCFK